MTSPPARRAPYASPPAFAYRLGGLNVASTIELPELAGLPVTQAAPWTPDLSITLGTVPASLPDATYRDAAVQASAHSVLLQLEQIGRFLVSNGEHIRVAPEPGVPESDLRLFLLGAALGIACHQRGLLPLHASAVVVDDRAIAFVGESGAGKSTLGAWLATRGYPLLCDDICILEPHDDRAPTAHPGVGRIKLWQDALDALNLASADLQRDFSRLDKYHVMPGQLGPARPATQAATLDRIYLLRETDTGTPFIGEPGSVFEAVTTIASNTYREEFIAPLGIEARHFRSCAAIAARVPVYPLHRRRDLSMMDAVTGVLTAHWQRDPADGRHAPGMVNTPDR